jgi:hypothetical protein
LRLIDSFGLDALDQHFLLMGCVLALGDDSFKASYPRLGPAALWRRFLSAVEGRISKGHAGQPNGPEYLLGLRALEGKVAQKVRPLLQLCDGVRDLSSVDVRSLPLFPESLGGPAVATSADQPEAWIARGTIQREKKERKDLVRKDRKKQPAEKDERAAAGTHEVGARANESEPAKRQVVHSPKDLLRAACPRCGSRRSAIKESSISARGTYACGAIFIAFSGPKQDPLVVKPCGDREPPAPSASHEADFLGE